MEITIRPIRDRERETFLERVVATTHADLPDHQRTRLTAKEIFFGVADVVDLLMAQGANEILVADTDEKANVGQVWLGTARDPYTGEFGGYIYDLFIDPAYRGQGIGKALMHAAEAASRHRGDKTLTLAVATWNHPAHTLYESLGYTPERLTMSKVLKK
jgi:ribosomal protein S18 acetylase RimI-like enzyme